MWWLRLLLIFCLVSPVWGATRIACASTGFTTATTWELVDHSATTGVAYLDSEAGTTAIPSPAASYSSNFLWAVTAPTVDGVAVKFSTRAAVASGTITVILRDVTGGADVKTVTVNVSDINANAPQGWYFFKFDAATALVAANNYAIGVKSSNATQGTLYRDATAANWSRMLRTTTTAAPAANDQLHVLGEWTAAATVTAITVTMDETATTSYGPTVAGGPPQGFTVGSQGTLNWGTTAATNYILYLKGILRVYPGGTMNIGTAGTPMPSTSTALYRMTSVANVDSGLIVDGTFSAYGATKAVTATLLTANVAPAGTVLQVVSTAGWAAGDFLGLGPTNQTYTEAEPVTILTVDSGVQVTLTAGVAVAHSGVSPTQAEVLNMTRNVRLFGVSATLQGMVRVNETATFSADYAEFYLLGSNIDNSRGITFNTTTGSAALRRSSVATFVVGGSLGIHLRGSAYNNVTISDTVGFNISYSFMVIGATTGTNITITNNIFLETTNTTFGTCIDLRSYTGTITGNTCAGAALYGIYYNSSSANLFTGTHGGFTIHATRVSGVLFDGAVPYGYTWSGTNTIWRCNSNNGTADGGIRGEGNGGYTIQNLTIFGCAQNSLVWPDDFGQGARYENLVSAGDTGFATTNALKFDSANYGMTLEFYSSTFGVVAGIRTAHTNFLDVGTGPSTYRIYAWNAIINVTNLFANFANSTWASGLFVTRYGQVAGDHRRFTFSGNALTNNVTCRTSCPSEELVPSSTFIKMRSGPKQAAVNAAGTVTWSVWVYKSAGYVSSQPRLVLKANPAIGIASDFVLDTATGGVGAWEELTGVTPGASGDAGVFEVYVDCDGTAGSVFIDDWSANGVLISHNTPWWGGLPYVVTAGQPIGGDTYWWSGSPAVGFHASPTGGGAAPIINNPIMISRRKRMALPTLKTVGP